MMHRLRNYFLAGLLIVAPVFLTVYVTWAFVKWIDSWVTPLIPAAYSPDTYLPFPVPGFGLIVALVFITLLGFLAANLVGMTLVSWGESILGRMPLVRNLYRGFKQLFQTALKTNSKAFKTVVMIEFPRKDMWTIAFLIGEAKGEIREKLIDRGLDAEVLAVFVPTAHITGYLAYVRRQDVIFLDLSAEDAAKVVISAGLVAPDGSSAELANGGKPINPRRGRATRARRGYPARIRRTASSRPKR